MAATDNNKTKPVTIIRPADTTAYAIGDVMNGASAVVPMELIVNTTDNKNLWILGGTLVSSVVQTTLNATLMLFDSSFTTAADNAAFSPSDAVMQDNYLGSVIFEAPRALAVNSFDDGATKSGKPIVVTPDENKIYGVLVMDSAYVPTSEEEITIVLNYEKAENA